MAKQHTVWLTCLGNFDPPWCAAAPVKALLRALPDYVGAEPGQVPYHEDGYWHQGLREDACEGTSSIGVLLSL